MDSASRKLCNTDDNQEALTCGKWHCHENCWNDSAKVCIESGKPTDIKCIGGIHLYAEPIMANQEVIGSINIGYGNPPTDEETLKTLSERFGTPIDDLRQAAEEYDSRPHFIIELAKKRLKTSAQLIGKMVESTLAQKEYQTLFDGASDAIFLADTKTGVIIDANRKAEMLLGRERDEIIGMHQSHLHPEESREQVTATFRTHFEKGSENLVDGFYVEHKDGHTIPVEISPSIIEVSGEKLVYGIFRDITERKQAEEETRKTTHELNEKVKELNCLFELSGLIEKHNNIPLVLTNLPPLIKKSWRYPDVTEVHVTYLNDTYQTDNFRETPWLRSVDIYSEHKKVGSIRIAYLEEQPPADEGPFLSNERSLLQAIADRLGRFIERVNTTELYNELFESVNEAILFADSQGVIKAANPVAADLCGYSAPEELIGLHMETLYSEPEKRAVLLENLKRDGGRCHNFEVAFKRKDGTIVDTMSNIVLLKDQKGEMIGTLGALRDVSELKRIQTSLNESTQRLSATLDALPDLMFEVDRQGIYYTYHAPFEDNLLVSPDQFIGKPISGTLPDETAEIVLAALEEAAETGKHSGAVYKLDLPKGERWFELSIAAKGDHTDPDCRFIVLARDITDRKEAEEQIKANLKENETLLKEIHHRVKNNMNVVSGLLSLHKNSTQNEEVRRALQESQGRVYAMSAVHETLHNTKNLAEIDLIPYLNKLSTSLIQSYSVNPGKVQLTVDGDNTEVNIVKASPLGLSINELISNALKYAFPDERSGKIEITTRKQNDQLELSIKDNGIGMPEGFDWKNSNTLGLKLVRNLVENQLNGSIDADTQDGTQFTIKINLDVKHEQSQNSCC